MSDNYVIEHSKQENIINQYKENPNKEYMLTVSRDGEYPERSVYKYSNALDAVNGYNRYTDWGFARQYLTVSLYEPNGKIHTKILKRPPAGENIFIREQYYEAEKILLKLKDKIEKECYNQLVKDFAKLFSIDNWRFDPKRFFSATQCDGEVIE